MGCNHGKQPCSRSIEATYFRANLGEDLQPGALRPLFGVLNLGYGLKPEKESGEAKYSAGKSAPWAGNDRANCTGGDGKSDYENDQTPVSFPEFRRDLPAMRDRNIDSF